MDVRIGAAFVLVSLLFLFDNSSNAQGIKSFESKKGGGDVIVDGRVGKEEWKNAARVSGFRQLRPDEGRPSSKKTSVNIYYGDNNLYIGAMLYDDNPSLIRQRLTRRDNYNKADWFLVSIDSNFDRTNAFTFGVNAAGVQYDALQRGSNRNDSWNAVWESEVQKTENGWEAELRIPYSMLRFPETESQTWGIQFTRRIPRFSEQSEWPLVPRSERKNLVSNYGRMTDITGISPRPNVQIRPYSVARFQARESSENPGSAVLSRSVDVGGNMQIGIGSNATLDAAVNPDFGQVESDPAVLNLTAFETFFDEKRPFFVEGQQYYQFEVSGGDLFYSRRIGSQDPIIGASKFSGRTNDGLSFGVLGATTGSQFSPSRGYGVARLSQQFDRYSRVGGMLTTFDGPARSGGRQRSVAGGSDWDVRFQDNKYALRGYGAFVHERQSIGSASPETGLSGQMEVEKQEGTFRMKANTKITETEFNPNNVGQLTRDRTNFAEAFTTFDYEVNQGRPFGPFRRGRIGGSFAQTYSVDNWLSRRQFAILKSNLRTMGFQDLSLNVRLFNFLDSYDLYETRGLWPRNREYHLKVSSGLSTDDRREWKLSTDGSYTIRGGGGKEYGLTVSGNWNASDRVSLSGSLSGDWENGVLAWSANESLMSTNEGWKIGNRSVPPDELSPNDYTSINERSGLGQKLKDVPTTFGGQYYVPVYGNRDTRSLDLTLRSTVAFTPTISIQVYSQIFWARGEYENFSVLANRDKMFGFPGYPRSNKFKIENFQSNFVFRWRFRPGSTFYFVWDHLRNGRKDINGIGNNEEMGYREGIIERFRDTFNLFPNNNIILKLEYNLQAINILS
jgi:hypothetical protein